MSAAASMAHRGGEPGMDVVEITTKTALVKSRIPGPGFAINPYRGCGHGCTYCYATFMRKYSRAHANSRWGEFVEVKTAAGVQGVTGLSTASRR
jgi:DNA repair photolyase